MTCRETERLLDLFLDGELEARTMRAVALHVTRCPPCEALLRGLERLQEVVADSVADAVADVDFSRFWPGIAAQVDAVQRSSQRLRHRLRELTRQPAVVAAGMAAALAVSAFVLWRELPGTVGSAPANNQARIDALATDAPSVALLSEPISNTTVIWIAEEGDPR
jgi:anti-sigma factor RsiW